MDNRSEIKKANRRAMPKFLLIMAASMLAGGVAGFFCARYGLDRLAGGMKEAASFFGANVAPWLMLALVAILPAVCVPIDRGIEKRLAAWNGEDEGVDEAEKLSVVIWLSQAVLIVSFFLLAAVYSGGFAIFDQQEGMFFLSIAAFFVIMIETVVLQQKCVDAVKRINPEKTASIYDMRFQRKWMDSCDEAEKLMIGRCAFKAYRATNLVCLILAVLLAICALVFDAGLLPSLVVCVIWIVNHTAYAKEAIQSNKAGYMIL